MSDKFNNKFRIPSARLQTWDYGSNGAYFITICTKNKETFFGVIGDVIESSAPTMQLNEMGKLAEQYWMDIPNHFPFIELGNFVVMPNHVHGILIMDKTDMHFDKVVARTAVGVANIGDNVVATVAPAIAETRQCLVSTNTTPTTNPTSTTKTTPTKITIINEPNKTVGQTRFRNQGSNTISSIVGAYKSVVSKNLHLMHSDFGWQSRFHDHIIRNAESFERIQNYIATNPQFWKDDKFYS